MDVAEDIGFEGCVHGDDAESAYHLGVVAQFAGTYHHSEHSVDILVTDQGIADLRGKDPVQRAETIINNCAHPPGICSQGREWQ